MCLLLSELDVVTGIQQGLEVNIVGGGDLEEDPDDSKAVLVTDSLYDVRILGVVVDQMHLQWVPGPIDRVLRSLHGGVAPMKMRLGEDVLGLETSTLTFI